MTDTYENLDTVKQYERLSMEVIDFESKDIITESYPGAGEGIEEGD